MLDDAPQAVAIPSAAQLSTLTVVAEGGSFIVGSPRTGEYVEVPELGAKIVEWLQRGLAMPECERRAAELTGEPVDIVDFLTVLADEGLFGERRPPGTQAEEGTDDATVSTDTDGQSAEALRVRLGKLLFQPAAWAGYAIMSLAGPVLLLAMPHLRPSYRDGFPFSTQLFNILAVSVLGMAAVALHEGAHVLATAAHGLRSRLSVSRRLYFLTFQADLTRLWSVPRRTRYGPLLAGITCDAVIMAAALALEATVAQPLGPIVVRLLRALVLLQFTALLAQFMVFMRTDVYALLVNATGCTTLWATKGALLRRLLHRANLADERQLADASPREIVWARRYLWLYVPGIIVALGYLVYFVLPSLPRLIELCVAPIRTNGLTTIAAWEGLAALAIAVVPSLLALAGAARSGVRVLATAARRRQGRPDQAEA